MLGDTRVQTILRASTLTILATCTEASPLALLPYSETIVDACLTLLSLESRPGRKPEPPTSDDEDSEGTIKDKPRPKRAEETPEALTLDTRHPALRRGALLFLALQARAQRRFNESRATLKTAFFPSGLLSKAKTVVQYVEDVDADELVRHQAAETLEELDALSPIVTAY